MYIYLSKKIAIPNNIGVSSLAWNHEDGFIAVGGQTGLLKVLKLDWGLDTETALKTAVATSNLSINQTLEGHSETIQVITWNNKYRKLTTSDRSGMIIVWTLYKVNHHNYEDKSVALYKQGTWYEEMINNRKKSVVVDMIWSGEGTKICIAYEDGGIIVGSVDGNRIWGRDIKNVTMTKVQWSPDGKLLLFGFADGNVHLYDAIGLFSGSIELIAVAVLKKIVDIEIVGLEWYNGQNGYLKLGCPTLAICCKNGCLQFMRSPVDPNVIMVDTHVTVACCSWNHNATWLAVVGRQDDSNKVLFYTPFGEHLQTLKLPGQEVTCCAWEEGSLRIAFGVDSSVYFANISPDYKWCYLKNTLVYTSGRILKEGVCITFWDVISHQFNTQYIVSLVDLAGSADHCVLASYLGYDDPMGRYSLTVCNTLGTIVDVKYVTDIEVKWVAMNSTHVAIASKNNYFLWKYTTPQSTVGVQLKPQPCRMYDTSFDPTGTSVMDVAHGIQTTYDPICAIVISEKYLIIAKESGTIKQFVVPHVVIIKTYNLCVPVHKMSLNCNSTRLSVIHTTGILKVLDISEAAFHHTDAENTRLERKDAWVMCWASDHPQLLAIMEKTKMYVFKGIHTEEPILTLGHICSFENLEVQIVLLDKIIDKCDKPSKESIVKFEIKTLRDTRHLLEKVGFKEAHEFIEDNPHPRLWKLLAESALKDLNFKLAEEAFIRSQDYGGLQYLKRLQFVTRNNVKQGLIAAYFSNFEEAEKRFNENDRTDLTLHLRKTLGDWFEVIRMLKYGVYSTPGLLDIAYNRAGDYFTHLNNWTAAHEYYVLAQNKKKIVEMYFQLEDYKPLQVMIDDLDESDPILVDIANGFKLHGIYLSAIKAYLKLKDIKSAVKISIEHHLWDQTVYIAKKYRMKELSQIFLNCSNLFLKQNKFHRAVEINVQAKYWFTAAKCAIKLAQEETKKDITDPMKIKRMYVYAAQLVETYKNDPESDEEIDTMADVNLLENCWQGAIAFHLLMLVERQIFLRQIHDAACTLYRLQEYISYIPAEQIYLMLTFAAYFDKLFYVCSKTLIKLDCLPDLTPAKKKYYDNLAFKIFMRHAPVNSNHHKISINCFNCQSAVPDWEIQCPYCKMHFPVCVASGRSLISEDVNRKVCYNCHHVIIEKYLGHRKNCPLCHTAFSKSVSAGYSSRSRTKTKVVT